MIEELTSKKEALRAEKAQLEETLASLGEVLAAETASAPAFAEVERGRSCGSSCRRTAATADAAIAAAARTANVVIFD